MRIKTLLTKDHLYLLSHLQFKHQLTAIKSNNPDLILKQINYQREDEDHLSTINFLNLPTIGIKSNNQYHLTIQSVYDRLFILQQALSGLIPDYNMNRIQLIYDANLDQLHLGHYYRQIFYHNQPVMGFQKLIINYQFNDLYHFLTLPIEDLITKIKTNNANDNKHFYGDLVDLINQHLDYRGFNNDQLNLKINQVYHFNNDSLQIVIAMQNNLANSKLEKINLTKIENWKQAINDYMQENLPTPKQKQKTASL